MKRKGLTLFELMVTIFILGVFALLVVCICGGGCYTVVSNMSGNGGQGGVFTEQPPFVGTVVRKYEIVQNDQTYFRVDVKKEGSDFVDTLQNVDDPFHRKYNSATIHANLQEGKQYTFYTRGIRDEVWSRFPNIENVEVHNAPATNPEAD